MAEKTVLVTGANGFIGKHLLSPLKASGFQIHGLTTRRLSTHSKHCQWHEVNLLDEGAIVPVLRAIRPTHGLHLAWYTVSPHYWHAAENVQWVQASLSLMRHFAEQGGQRLVMAGTCAEYDWSQGYCEEALTPKRPATPYGVCKNALYEMMQIYSTGLGLSSAWGRIFFLYGPHEAPHRLVPAVIQALLQQEAIACSDGTQIRDFLYVKDAATALVRLLDSDVTGAVNIASGAPVTVKEVILTIADRLQRPNLIQWGSRPISSHEPPLLVANVDRLQALGWSPQFQLQQGIEETIGWWQSFHP